ncbi:MAG: hypothetical protein V1816_25510 [Pseudomonadota bacterium]
MTIVFCHLAFLAMSLAVMIEFLQPGTTAQWCMTAAAISTMSESPAKPEKMEGVI